MKRMLSCFNSLRISAGVAAIILVASGSPAIEAADFSPKEIYRQTASGVVLILATDGDRRVAKGTGSIIHPSGLILTNAHVIFHDEAGRPFKRVVVFLKPEILSGDPKRDLQTGYETKVVHYNRELDLSLLKMEQVPSDLTVLPLAGAGDVEIGEYVVAIGHPETAGLWTLTTGTISTIIKNMGDVDGKDVYQTETSLNRGNSGGPLLDGAGMLVGVNTAVSRLAPDGFPITDINFAIKSDVVRSWLSHLGVSALPVKPHKPLRKQPRIAQPPSSIPDAPLPSLGQSSPDSPV